jgi:hypothetical protein
VSKPVKVNGRPLAQGKYSVWMVVKQTGDWTLVLDPKSHIFHMDPPDSNAKQIRVPVKVDHAPFTDVLTWSFPELRANGSTMVMQWERVRIPIDIEVQPSLDPKFPSAEADLYTGSYEYTELDSTGKAGKVTTFNITYEDGTLKARWVPDDPYMQKFALIRIANDWFAPGLYDESGRIYEVLKPDLIVEFRKRSNRAESFVVRGEDDTIYASGKRKTDR